MKPSSQVLMKEDGDGHSSIGKEKIKATEKLLGARIIGANLHASSYFTPIKASFGIPSQLQTPSSKLSYLSTSGRKHSVGAGGRTMDEDASGTRTPFRLLAGENLSGLLFSPSHTPRPIAVPSIFDKIVSPALKGHAKRVLVMPPTLSPARRVPVRRRRSELASSTGKQSLFTIPKSRRVDSVGFMTPPKSSRDENVLPFTAPPPSAVGNEINATGWNDVGSPMQHHNRCNVKVCHAEKSLGGSELPKRVLAMISARALVATPSSSRVGHLLEEAHHLDGFPKAESVQPQNEKHEGEPMDRPELVKRAIAFMPRLSSTARRVPLRKKEKQAISAPSSNNANNTPRPATGKSRPEAGKTSKSGEVRGEMCGNEVDVAKKQAATSLQNTTERLERRKVKRTGGKVADKAGQETVHTYKTKSHLSKECIDVIERAPKAKGQTAAGKAKLKAKHPRVSNHQIKSHSSKRGDGIASKAHSNHQIKSHSSKRGDGIASKTHRNDSCLSSDIADVTQDHEDGKVREAFDVNVRKSDDTKQCCDAKSGSSELQHDDDTRTKHHEDFGGYGLSEINDGSDDKNQKADSHIAAGGGDDQTNLDGNGSKKHSGDDHGANEHGYGYDEDD